MSVATIDDGVTTNVGVGLKEVLSRGAAVVSFCGVILTSPPFNHLTLKMFVWSIILSSQTKP